VVSSVSIQSGVDATLCHTHSKVVFVLCTAIYDNQNLLGARWQNEVATPPWIRHILRQYANVKTCKPTHPNEMKKSIVNSDLPITVNEAAASIIRELREKADPRKAESARRFFTESIISLGIDAPTMRALARSWILRLKPAWHLNEARDLCDLLFQQPDIESRAAGFLILGGFTREFDRTLWSQSETWLNQRLDNWALIDGFCSTVLSPLLKQHPEGVRILRRWTRSRCMWMRRASVVTLVPFARHGEQLDLAYELAEALLGQKEDLMHKAVGWLLREAGKTNPQRLKEFLLLHGPAIPRTSLRYAIERFPAEERQRLLLQTRNSTPHD
jgi:3-methyladenine DNA glycosylase AlkD